jgi:3-dehydroquinate synthase
LDTRYSVASGLLPEGEDERVLRLLKALGFLLWHDGLRQRGTDGRHVILQGLAEFQQHLGGELTITLLSEIGRGVEVHTMDHELVGRGIDWLEQRA